MRTISIIIALLSTASVFGQTIGTCRQERTDALKACLKSGVTLAECEASSKRA